MAQTRRDDMVQRSPARRARRRMRAAVGGICLALAAVAATPASAGAAFGLDTVDGAVSDAGGGAFTQAGGHPYSAGVTFKLNTTEISPGVDDTDGSNVRHVQVDLPPGFVGNPTAVVRCSKDLAIPGFNEAVFGDPTKSCPANSIVGTATILIAAGGENSIKLAPVFAIEPPPGVAAQFGFNYLDQRVYLNAAVRSDSDYGLTVTARNINQAVSVLGTTVTLWGVPASPSHDFERCLAYVDGLTEPSCFDTGGMFPGAEPQPSNLPSKAFITNPTTCTPAGVGLVTNVFATAWDQAHTVSHASFESHLPDGYTLLDPLPPSSWGPPQGPTGCENLNFNPTMRVQPDQTKPDAPIGLAVDLAFPQEQIARPSETATAHLKRAHVTLPEGMTVSPSAADGLRGCTDAQLDATTLDQSACPEASKIGTVEATTPLLDEKLSGNVFVGSQESDDPESGRLFRIMLVLGSKERGVLVKLPGSVRADAATGQLQATFDNNPQLPVSSISLRFKSGPRAPLATPPTCGPKTVTAQLTSWAGQSVNLSDTFTIDCPGDTGFAPSFSAGALNPSGGASSPFSLTVMREDRDKELKAIRSVRLPEGLSGRVASVPLCGEVQAAAGTCPESSRVGHVQVAAGPGSSPLWVPQAGKAPTGVYLTGPYRGAPFGLSIKVPAQAGPFDLGTVVVRSALRVDPRTAAVTAETDDMPTILKGVPLRVREVRVILDRSGFVFNPTSCAAKSIDATLAAIDGELREVSSRFQVADCANLGVKPRLRLRLTGRRQMRKDGGHPGLRARLTQRAGEANLENVKVRLPLSLALDPDNAQSLCEYEDGLRVDCPAESIIGRARAVTPVLGEPLTGPVYFVKGVRIHPKTGARIRTLPTLLIPLRGEVAIDLRAKSSVRRGKLVTTFANVPDAPVSRFALRLKGGRHGILTTVRNPCRGKQRAVVSVRGHNNRRTRSKPRVKAPCGKSKSKRAKRNDKGKARRSTVSNRARY